MTLRLVRTAAERTGDEVVIDDTPAEELVTRIFAAPRVVVWGEPLRLLDLTGEVCPFTFVRTKLALEELPAGARLVVRVDHEPATRNVPRSAADWGQKVLGVAPAGPGRWDIHLEKGPT
jgi:tRNA 2-thiouridine synthesizing protein A